MTTAFTNQLIMFGSLALDITSGTAELAAPTGAPGQCWSLNVLADGVTCFLVPATNPNGVALDPTIMTLAAAWYSASSNQALSVIPATWGAQMQFVCNAKGQALTASGNSIVLAAIAGAVLATPPVYSPPPPGSTTAATIIPNLPVTGFQGAWSPLHQQFDSDWWLTQLTRPDVDSAGNQNCVVMTNGIGIQSNWSQYDSDAWTSGQIMLGDKSISQPNAPQWVAIPLGAFPPSDSTSPTLAQAGTGAFNSHYANAAGQFGGMQNRVIWRLMWEGIAANNNWYPWGYNYPGSSVSTYPQDFIAAWNQMAATVLPILPGELCWNLNQDFLSCPVWQQCWPTGKYQPSIIGVDVYYQGWMGAVGSDGGTGVFNQYHLPGLQAAATFAEQNNCRFAICEWGIQNGDAPGWVTALGQFITSLNGKTVTINGQTLPLYVYAGAYIVGPDCIDPGGTPLSMAVYETPPFAL